MFRLRRRGGGSSSGHARLRPWYSVGGMATVRVASNSCGVGLREKKNGACAYGTMSLRVRVRVMVKPRGWDYECNVLSAFVRVKQDVHGSAVLRNMDSQRQ